MRTNQGWVRQFWTGDAEIRWQSNEQKHQGNMEENPKSGVMCKTRKSVKFQIEEDKVIDAHVTQW